MAQRQNIVTGRAHQGGVEAKTAYESTVIARAMQRASANPHLKGHIQEILVQDSRNVRNLFNGARTELTKSTTASTVDLVTTKGGKVIERIQVKDVTSQSGINKLVKQCADGKCRSAKLVGAEETTQAFHKAAEKAGISKRMTSSGVSTKDTTSLAQRAGATGSGSLGSAIGQAARSGGVAGAGIGAGVETVRGIYGLHNSDADALEVAGRVAKAAVAAAGPGAAAAVTALGLTGGIAVAATVGVPLVAVVAIGYAASEVFDGVCDFFSGAV